MKTNILNINILYLLSNIIWIILTLFNNKIIIRKNNEDRIR